MSSGHSFAPSVDESLREYGRGLAGGLLFSLPLLYTMEVWWAGFIADPARLLVYLAAIFALLLAYNRFAGMHQDASHLEVVIDSFEELGLGLVTSAMVLLLLGRIGPATGFSELVGKIVVEAGMVAIGFSVGTAQLGAGAKGGGDSGTSDEAEREPAAFLGQLAIALCGAVLIAANVAPTEEILIIAFQTSPLHLLSIVAFSILIAALVLYFSGFARAQKITGAESSFDVVVGTVITYAVALTASAAMLWFFGRFDGVSLTRIIAMAVVLGFPAVLGASAGRLLLQT